MTHPSFAVRRSKNRNGIFTWRADDRINGARIRRDFETQEEAAAEKAALRDQVGADRGWHAVGGHKPHGRTSPLAEAAFHRLTRKAMGSAKGDGVAAKGDGVGAAYC